MRKSLIRILLVCLITALLTIAAAAAGQSEQTNSRLHVVLGICLAILGIAVYLLGNGNRPLVSKGGKFSR